MVKLCALHLESLFDFLNVTYPTRTTLSMVSPEKSINAPTLKQMSARPKTSSSSTAHKMSAHNESLVVVRDVQMTLKRRLASVSRPSTTRTCRLSLTMSNLERFVASMLHAILLKYTKILAPLCSPRSPASLGPKLRARLSLERLSVSGRT